MKKVVFKIPKHLWAAFIAHNLPTLKEAIDKDKPSHDVNKLKEGE